MPGKQLQDTELLSQWKYAAESQPYAVSTCSKRLCECSALNQQPLMRLLLHKQFVSAPCTATLKWCCSKSWSIVKSHTDYMNYCSLAGSVMQRPWCSACVGQMEGHMPLSKSMLRGWGSVGWGGMGWRVCWLFVLSLPSIHLCVCVSLQYIVKCAIINKFQYLHMVNNAQHN